MNALTMSSADRWMDEQLFEEDLRAVMQMMRPHRRERLAGWSEYRTGGAGYRVTVSWSDEFQKEGGEDTWRVPRIAEVLESLLVGSVSGLDEISPQLEFAMYREVVEALRKRLDELEECYT
jgi:hypothetical protein